MILPDIVAEKFRATFCRDFVCGQYEVSVFGIAIDNNKNGIKFVRKGKIGDEISGYFFPGKRGWRDGLK